LCLCSSVLFCITCIFFLISLSSNAACESFTVSRLYRCAVMCLLQNQPWFTSIYMVMPPTLLSLQFVNCSLNPKMLQTDAKERSRKCFICYICAYHWLQL
jgi:hypothetical protein